MRRNHDLPGGAVHRLEIACKSLRENMLGDPVERVVDVYIPHNHSGTGLPIIVELAAFGGSGLKRTSWAGFSENLVERLDRLIAHEKLKPCVFVFPDCFTRLGGNQYVDSIAMGRWATCLVDDMLPFVENKFQCGGKGKRGLIGRSSGGYGALVNGMKYPHIWSAIACHSGDMGFDELYLSGMPVALRAIARHGNSIEQFIRFIDESHRPGHDDLHALMILAMAASYDPDPESFCGVQLPVDRHTCALDPKAWARWLAWDPLHIVDRYVDALKSLKGIWIDCGNVDQYNLVYMARRLEHMLKAARVEHTYEEFPDGHFSTEYRYDRSVPFLVDRLS